MGWFDDPSVQAFLASSQQPAYGQISKTIRPVAPAVGGGQSMAASPFTDEMNINDLMQRARVYTQGENAGQFGSVAGTPAFAGNRGADYGTPPPPPPSEMPNMQPYWDSIGARPFGAGGRENPFANFRLPDLPPVLRQPSAEWSMPQWAQRIQSMMGGREAQQAGQGGGIPGQVVGITGMVDSEGNSIPLPGHQGGAASGIGGHASFAPPPLAPGQFSPIPGLSSFPAPPTGEFKMQWTPEQLKNTMQGVYGKPNPYALDSHERTGNPYDATIWQQTGPYRGVYDTQGRDMPNPAYAAWEQSRGQGANALIEAMLKGSLSTQLQAGKFGADMNEQQLKNLGMLDVAKASQDTKGELRPADSLKLLGLPEHLKQYATDTVKAASHGGKTPPEPAVGPNEWKTLESYFPPDKPPDRNTLASYIGSNKRFLDASGNSLSPEAAKQMKPLIDANMHRFGGQEKYDKENAYDLIYNMKKAGVNQAGGWTLSGAEPKYTLSHPKFGNMDYYTTPANDVAFDWAEHIATKGDAATKARNYAFMMSLGKMPMDVVPQVAR